MQTKKPLKYLPTILLVVAAMAWGAAVGTFAEIKLYNLASSWAYDLAFFNNLLFNTVDGAWFAQTSSPHEARGLLQLHHTYPILLAVVPLYALLPDVSTLLWVQVIATASSALPASRLARKAGATRWESAAIGLCFLLQAPLVMTALCDFRPIVLGIPLVLWTVVVALEDRKVATALLCAATLAVREDMIYLVGALGLVMMGFPIQGSRRPVQGLVLSLMAAAYWIAMKAVGGELTYYFNPSEIGSTGHTTMALPSLQEVRFLAPYLLPLGLAAPLAWPLLVPGGLVCGYLLFISPYEWADWLGVYGHHAAPLLASVGAAAVLGWARLLTRTSLRWRRYVLAGLLVLQLAATALLLPRQIRSTTGPRQDSSPSEIQAVHEWIATIGADERVACDYASMALLSGRKFQYAVPDFRMTEEDRFPWSGEDFPPGFEDVDIVLLDAQREPTVELAAARCQAFGLAQSHGDYRLYERVAPGGEECSAQLR